MGKLQNVKKLSSDSTEVTRIQEYISRCFGGIISSQIINGTLLENVSLTTGLNKIPHKLGRKPQGWIVVRKRSTGDIWDAQDINGQAKLTLNLQSGGDIIVDLWVF